jgi:hypothetical protein
MSGGCAWEAVFDIGWSPETTRLKSGTFRHWMLDATRLKMVKQPGAWVGLTSYCVVERVLRRCLLVDSFQLFVVISGKIAEIPHQPP